MGGDSPEFAAAIARRLAQAAHSHLVCEECVTVIEVGDQLLESLAALVLAEHGITIDSCHFAMRERRRGCGWRPPEG